MNGNIVNKQWKEIKHKTNSKERKLIQEVQVEVQEETLWLT